MQKFGNWQSQNRSFLISVLIHVALLSLVWVGFPVPLQRNHVEFFYSGSFMPAEEAPNHPQSPSVRQKPISIKSLEGGAFAPWINARDLNKPKH
jgi:hypothetical protein